MTAPGDRDFSFFTAFPWLSQDGKSCKEEQHSGHNSSSDTFDDATTQLELDCHELESSLRPIEAPATSANTFAALGSCAESKPWYVSYSGSDARTSHRQEGVATSFERAASILQGTVPLRIDRSFESVKSLMPATILPTPVVEASPSYVLATQMKSGYEPVEPVTGHSEDDNCDFDSWDGGYSWNVTTVMLRNILCRHTEKDVAALLDSAGLNGLYSFVYVPRSPSKTRFSNWGYAFVNFKDAAYVTECYRRLHGMRFPESGSKKTVAVHPARVQGR
eukprot:CAMPEP_0115168392 /NCGR_PEP_ID=MMETSP0270-20121206/724_1 /TAXON_ID=71861 /ORGANISM="Scrippsiella trochoidea, Strain CCMP3099" /LENGTH=276 /DNA_ID=CAMNT_0002581047 /DNA_START=82 /DNA_END=908 /DNA_ORIENTATION=+